MIFVKKKKKKFYFSFVENQFTRKKNTNDGIEIR